MIRISRRRCTGTSTPLFSLSGRVMSPLSVAPTISTGTAIHTSDATSVFTIIFTVVTCPPIHSIMVVTSPMGLHAPPALAASITMPAKSHRSFLSAISLLSRAHMTMAVVMLSSNAERKKVSKLSSHSSFFLFVVVILSVMIRKPW